MAEEVEIPSKKKLTYCVHKYSSVSSSYVPENIIEDKPSDQSSRWSSDTNSPPQYLVLKLDRPAVVTSILFGKYEKTHVCNLKRFKVYGGIDEENMIEILDSGLKNDPVSERFRCRHSLNGHLFPCQYIKIVPIQSWGPSFNFSIWYVAIEGDDNQGIVVPALTWHEQFREREAIRMCLKHFRQHHYLDVFDTLQKKTKIQLEHHLLTELHTCLVQNGEFEKTEQLVQKALEDRLFDSWINAQQPRPKWTPLIQPEDDFEDLVPTPIQTPVPTPGNLSPDEDSPIEAVEATGDEEMEPPTHPGNRGGHQMIIDGTNQLIYLFGGWDGSRDLSDFWCYDIKSSRWQLLSNDTEADGGPSPRSCHKMVLDKSCRNIFILGRYVERGLRENARNIKSDFYMYDISSNVWTLITDDTSAMGGPSLIFDHQMCIDQESRTIYVFGGQSLYPSVSPGTEEARPIGEKRFSGLYQYIIPTNSWRKLRDDCNGTSPSQGEVRSRSSHSMLFQPALRKLFIFGGQRKRDEYLTDFFSYHVDRDEIEIISTGISADSAIPAVGHTQRSTIDCERNEIHVMTGLNKDKDKADKRGNDCKVSNSFWVYNIKLNKWTCFYRNENNSVQYWSKMQHLEPRPRYAHQLVYDEITRTHFMFGGNPGGKEGKEDRVRLGDFWKLNLIRPSHEEVLRKCQLLIRKTRFSELVLDDPMGAVLYLQTKLAECVDHGDPKEEKEFQLLASKLFGVPSDLASPATLLSERVDPHHSFRTSLFDCLSTFFPDDMTQPRGNLVDLIPYPMDMS